MTNVTPQERADVRKDAERLCWRWLDILDEELQTNQMTKAAALTAASLLASNVIRRCAEQGDEDNLTQMFVDILKDIRSKAKGRNANA